MSWQTHRNRPGKMPPLFVPHLCQNFAPQRVSLTSVTETASRSCVAQICRHTAKVGPRHSAVVNGTSMGSEQRVCEVRVVCGGPAGSTVAARLAQRGRQGTLLEKEQFPRFHIGESLLPLNLFLFESSVLARRSSGSAFLNPARK